MPGANRDAVARAARRLPKLWGALAIAVCPAAVEVSPAWSAEPIAHEIRPDTVLALGAPGPRGIPPLAVALVAPGGGSPAADIRLLVGGSGIYAREDLESELALGHVGPLWIGPRCTGFLWRAAAGSVDYTRVLAADHFDSRRREEPRHLVYLRATPLAASTRMLSRREWHLYCVPAGASSPGTELVLETGLVPEGDPGSGGAHDVLIFLERDPGTWFLVDRDHVPPRGVSAALPLDPGRDHAVVVRARDGRADFRLSLRADPTGEPTGQRWRVIADDDGEADSPLAQVSEPRHELIKRLLLPDSLASPAAARLVYRMGRDPYWKARGARSGPGDPSAEGWGRLIIRVNDVQVLREPLPESAGLGWHVAPIPTRALRAGMNEIRLSLEGEDYFYVSVDTDRSRGRSGSAVSGKLDMRSWRPGRSSPGGELMIRLEVR